MIVFGMIDFSQTECNPWLKMMASQLLRLFNFNYLIKHVRFYHQLDNRDHDSNKLPDLYFFQIKVDSIKSLSPKNASK